MFCHLFEIFEANHNTLHVQCFVAEDEHNQMRFELSEQLIRARMCLSSRCVFMCLYRKLVDK